MGKAKTAIKESKHSEQKQNNTKELKVAYVKNAQINKSAQNTGIT